MSAGFSERRSWRQKKQTGSNRWLRRVVVTALCVLLLGLIIYMMLPEAKPHLHAFVVHPGYDFYDNDMIVPPMFGKQALQQIVASMEASESWGDDRNIGGKVVTIRNDLGALPKKLSDQQPTDSTMVIVRGYLMTDADGHAALACADLGVKPGSTDVSGLLPISELLQPLAAVAADDFEGGRLLVFDIEPLGALPRLNQYGDAALQALAEEVAGLEAEYADRLWVLVTRGAMQSPGWDPTSQLPISTQTFLNGLKGDADVDDDRAVTLKELVAYMARRYQRLDPRAPEIIVMRGGVGRLENSDAVDDLWLAEAETPPEPEEEEEAKQDSDEAEQNGDAEKSAATAGQGTGGQGVEVSWASYGGGAAGQNVRTVALRAQDQADTAAKPDSGEAADPKSDAATAGESKENDQDVDPPSDPPEVDNNANSSDPTEQAAAVPETFWHLRDRLEQKSSNRSLHPIALAPHLWRRIVLAALHSDVGSLPDPQSGFSAETQSGLQDLIAAIDSSNPPGRLGAKTTDIQEIYAMWIDARNSKRRSRIDDQVRAADELQFAIAVARTHWWSLCLCRQQAIGVGTNPINILSDWHQRLNDAEDLLADQTGDQVQVQRLKDEAAGLWMLIRRSKTSVSDEIGKLLDDFDRNRGDDAWREIRKAYVFLRSPLPTAGQRDKLNKAVGQALIDPFSPDRDSETSLEAETFGVAEAGRLGAGLAKRVQDEYRLWQRQSGNADEGTFAGRFAQSLRVDPRDRNDPGDTEMQAIDQPLLNMVVAVPRVPKPSWSIADSSNSRLNEKNLYVLQELRDHLSIEIYPDAEQRTEYELTYRLLSPSPLELQWEQGVVSGPDKDVARISVPAGKTGRVQLFIKSSDFASDEISEVGIEIEINPLSESESVATHIASLRGKREMKIGLPQRDRIRAVLECVGLSNEFRSGDRDNFTGGLWLRTFASRETRFRFSLYNESGRNCRAKVWLIPLQNPFYRDRVAEYWPDLIPERLDRLRELIMTSEGRVDLDVLEDALKGPKTIDLGTDPAALDWKPPAGEEPESSPSPPAPAEGAPEGNNDKDASHGLALVVRLLDPKLDDQPLPGGDQIIWLIPKPWTPAEYIEITEMEFRNRHIHVSAAIQVADRRR